VHDPSADLGVIASGQVLDYADWIRRCDDLVDELT
jgi:hypothetical protein